MDTRILFATLIALALTTTADGRTKPHRICAQAYEPGVGPVLICPPRTQRKHK